MRIAAVEVIPYALPLERPYVTAGGTLERREMVLLRLRTEGGVGRCIAAHHSESLEAWFVHIPGLYVVMPSTPYDAKGLLKAAIRDKSKPMDERFAAALKLAQLPRNGSKTRIRNRCELTGRSRGFYRKLKMSRIALRELSSTGMIPGMVKSSW